MEGFLVSDGNVSMVVDVSIGINIIIIISMNFIIRNVTTLSLWEYLWSRNLTFYPSDKMSHNLSSHIIWKQETDGKLITDAGVKKPEEPRM